MIDYENPNISDREININPSVILNCKIDSEGNFEYINHEFCEISGYEEYELISESLLKLFHPDMPKTFFKILMERLEKREDMQIVAKHLAKDGRYFWLRSIFKTKVNNEGKIIAHYSHSEAASSFAVHSIENLYKILYKIEAKTNNTKTSKKYLVGYLEDRNIDYNKYIEELCRKRPEYDRPRQPKVEPQRTTTTTFHQKTSNSESNLLHSKERTDPYNEEVKKKKRSLFQRVFGINR